MGLGILVLGRSDGVVAITEDGAVELADDGDGEESCDDAGEEPQELVASIWFEFDSTNGTAYWSSGMLRRGGLGWFKLRKADA